MNNGQSLVCVELLIHLLEPLKSHSFEATGPAFQNADLELHLAQFFLVLLLLFLMVLFLKLFKEILLFLQSLLDDLRSRDHPFFHLLHHFVFDLHRLVVRKRILSAQSSFLQERL